MTSQRLAPTGPGWHQHVFTVKVLGYDEGWRGMFQHLADVLRGRPCRSMRDVAFSIWAKKEADAVLVSDARVTLPRNRK